MPWAALSRSGTVPPGLIRRISPRALPGKTDERGVDRGRAGLGGCVGHGRGPDQGPVASGVYRRVLRAGARLPLSVAAVRRRGAVAARGGRHRAAADRPAQPGQGKEGSRMSRRARLMLFAVAAAGLAVTLGVGLAGLPSFGGQVTAYA